MSYVVDAVAFETGAFGSEEAGRIIPITERDFERAAAQLEGLSLRRYRSNETDDEIDVTAVLDFDTVETLERFLGSESLDIQLTESGGSWTQLIAPERVADSADEALAASLEQYGIVFVVEPPGQIVTVSGGQAASDRRSARVEVGLDEIVLADQAIVWSVEW